MNRSRTGILALVAVACITLGALHCSAVLADAAPCNAIARTVCERHQRCAPKSAVDVESCTTDLATSCITETAPDTSPGSVAADVRTCADAIESTACGQSVAGCNDLVHYLGCSGAVAAPECKAIVPEAFGGNPPPRTSSSSGSTSSGSTSTSSSSGSTSSGSASSSSGMTSSGSALPSASASSSSTPPPSVPNCELYAAQLSSCGDSSTASTVREQCQAGKLSSNCKACLDAAKGSCSILAACSSSCKA